MLYSILEPMDCSIRMHMAGFIQVVETSGSWADLAVSLHPIAAELWQG